MLEYLPFPECLNIFKENAINMVEINEACNALYYEDEFIGSVVFDIGDFYLIDQIFDELFSWAKSNGDFLIFPIKRATFQDSCWLPSVMVSEATSCFRLYDRISKLSDKIRKTFCFNYFYQIQSWCIFFSDEATMLNFVLTFKDNVDEIHRSPYQ